MDSFDIPNQITTTVNYTDIMASLSDQFIKVYFIFAAIVLMYTLFNIFVVSDFKHKEDIKQAFNYTVLILSLFVCAVSIQYYFI